MIEHIGSREFNIYIHLDSDQVFPDNPGMGTPALVIKKYKGKEYTATYNCALNEGELDCGEYKLTDAEFTWLMGQAGKVNDFIEFHTKQIKNRR